MMQSVLRRRSSLTNLFTRPVQRKHCSQDFGHRFHSDGNSGDNCFNDDHYLGQGLLGGIALGMTLLLFKSFPNAQVHAEGSDIVQKEKKRTIKKGMQMIRRKDVELHNCKESGIWVTYNDGVYDVSSFIENHPGGRDKVMMAAGKDLSQLWQERPYQLHYRSPLAFELLEEYRIGDLHPDDVCKDDFEVPIIPDETKYPTKHIYECIIVGSGLSGLECANSLIRSNSSRLTSKDVLILEASDYVGGRVKQIDSFIEGIPIDVGAEFIHGLNTTLAKEALSHNDELKELFCWAHGDGGPMDAPASNGGYGLYYLGGEGRSKTGVKVDRKGSQRLLRFDDKDEDFVRMNQVLSDMASLDENDFNDDVSLHDYLASLGFSDEMLGMASAGFSNTMCTNSRDLSMRQAVRWAKYWFDEEGEDGDFVFVNSFRDFIARLQKGLQIELNTPVVEIHHPKSDADIGLVRLTTSSGTQYYAKNVVVTAPPPVIANKIKFDPPLSEALQQALDSVYMHDVMKIFLKFSEPVWPKDLHGMIMAGNNEFLIPEVWFKDIDPQKVSSNEKARALAVCYTTADFTKRVSELPKDKVLHLVLDQLNSVFSLLEDRHMAATPASSYGNVELREARKNLKRPSEAFLGGMFWDWNAQHYPYITGGYCSPRAGKNTKLMKLLAEPYSHTGHNHSRKIIFFAGEATNSTAGSTAHAALDSGRRAAEQVAKNLA